jgi:putative flippase GtrA
LLLHLAVRLGLEPAWARLISLTCAMQVTFVLNCLHVFRGERRRWGHQWLRYMMSGGVGNFCNYWIFVTLVSTHWPIIAHPLFALCAGSFTAWVINFLAARFFVFGRASRAVTSILAASRNARHWT